MSILFSSSKNICIWVGSVILISALISVFSISNAELINAILALSILVGIPLWTISLSKTIPFTICVSSIEPPGFFSTLIFSRSTKYSSPFLVAMLRIASTTIFDKLLLSSEINFDCILVEAIFRSDALSLGSTFLDNCE